MLFVSVRRCFTGEMLLRSGSLQLWPKHPEETPDLALRPFNDTVSVTHTRTHLAYTLNIWPNASWFYERVLVLGMWWLWLSLSVLERERTCGFRGAAAAFPPFSFSFCYSLTSFVHHFFCNVHTLLLKFTPLFFSVLLSSPCARLHLLTVDTLTQRSTQSCSGLVAFTGCTVSGLVSHMRARKCSRVLLGQIIDLFCGSSVREKHGLGKLQSPRLCNSNLTIAWCDNDDEEHWEMPKTKKSVTLSNCNFTLYTV